MATIRHLSRPPITEALVDFRVSLPGAFKPESFAGVHEKIKDRYPSVDEMRRFEAQIQLEIGKSVSAQQETSGLMGYRFQSSDGRDVAQFRADGFTYNRLEPYTSWDVVRPEALRLWQLFVETTQTTKVDRLALRYINRLNLPPRGNLEDHLEVTPPVFVGAPRLLGDFLLRVSSYDPDTGDRANVTSALQLAGGSTLILDLDVSNTGGVGVSIKEIDPVLDRLHTMKNEIFFGTITEQTAERYE